MPIPLRITEFLDYSINTLCQEISRACVRNDPLELTTTLDDILDYVCTEIKLRSKG